MTSRLARAAIAALLVCLLVPRAADAQSWQWHFVVTAPGMAPVPAQSRVELHGDDVALIYTAHIRNADVPISTCRASVHDVSGAKSASHDGRAFLLIELKPQRTAACDGGPRTLATMPVVDDAALTDALATIDRACCGAPVAVASPPARTPPSARPVAVAATTQALLADWVESDGLFSFVRVRNRSDHPASILGGSVQNCRNVAAGCGGIPAQTIAPGAAVTIAAVMANPHAADATFTYRYDVGAGGARSTAGGTSTKAPSGWHPPMTAPEIRSGEALALAGKPPDTSPQSPSPSSGTSPAPRATRSAPPAFVDARLVRRGSSRLAIGIKGEALVRVHLDANGAPQSVDIVKLSDPRLSAAAIETAVSSAYAPPQRNGKPVSGTYVATFGFDGDDPALVGIPSWKRDPTPAPATSAADPGR